MANAPWYLKGETSTDGPSLKHHKLGLPEYNKDPGKLASRFERGARAVSWRDGSVRLLSDEGD